MNSAQPQLGENIKHLRTTHHLSVGDFANAIGCSRSIVNRLESDRSDNVPLRVVRAAAEYFGVRLDLLIEDDVRQIDELDWAIHQLRRRMSKDEQDSLIGIVEKSLKRRRSRLSTD